MLQNGLHFCIDKNASTFFICAFSNHVNLNRTFNNCCEITDEGHYKEDKNDYKFYLTNQVTKHMLSFYTRSAVGNKVA